jgi:hypothetical protein
VCSLYEGIDITDYGNGFALCIATVANLPPIQIPCTDNLFGTNCAQFTGYLTISIQNSGNGTAQTYIPPDINKWLTNIGLGTLVVLRGSLNVVVENFDPPIPVDLAPVFLTSLRQAASLGVYECQGPECDPTVVFDQPPRLTALPGLRNLLQLGDSSFSLTSPTTVQVSGTAFGDLGSFSGLTCVLPYASLQVQYNKALSTFQGMEALQPGSLGRVTINATGSGPFVTADSLAPLRSVAGCFATATPPYNDVNIPVGCDGILDNGADICTYQTPTCR